MPADDHDTGRYSACIPSRQTSLLSPPDPAQGLTPPWALRHYNIAADVAELDRLADDAEADLVAAEQHSARIEAALGETMRRHVTRGQDLTAAIEALKAELEKAMAAEKLALALVETRSPLAQHTGQLWQRVKALGADGHVRITWQPPDPMLPRQTVPPDRCLHLTIAYPGVLWGGTAALDALSLRTYGAWIVPGAAATHGPPPRPGTLRLDGHMLPRALIAPAVVADAARSASGRLSAADDDQIHACIDALYREAQPGVRQAGEPLKREILFAAAPKWLADNYSARAPQKRLSDCYMDERHRLKRRAVGSHD